MAEYKRKYRKAMSQVTQWMDEDSEYESQPLTDENMLPAGEDVLEDNDVESCQMVNHGESDEEFTGVFYDEEPLSSSEDELSSVCTTGDTLQTDLAAFMVSEHLTRESSNKLLALLRKHGHDLPKDCRTLIKTPRVVDVNNKCGGQYLYFGLKKCLQMVDLSCDAFYLSINIDGIPVYKSTNLQFWPILCCINAQPPLIVALYVGTSKPTSVAEFLCDFADEVKELQSHGFVSSDGVCKPVTLRVFVCDAPARAFLKNIKGHNCLSGCERCVAVGLSVNSRTTFCSVECFSAEKRDPIKFANLEYSGSHQIGPTPLCQIVGDCISVCALDYMHLVCLGAVRRMLMFWKKGGKEIRLSSSQVLQISERLVTLRDSIPSEFARRPRSLVELDRWKATEYRQFLLYTGPVVLKSVLPADIYKHFLCLSVSVSMMITSDHNCREHYLDYACQLMHHFVSNCERLYGTEFLVYNVHSLLHLGDDVKFFKASLDEISSFPFENFLQTLKRLIRSPSNPIAQVAKRIHEFEHVQVPITSSTSTRLKLSANSRDSVVLLKNGKFADIIVSRDDILTCAVYRRTSVQPFFTEPCSSDICDIVYCARPSCSTYYRDIMQTDIARKALKMPHGNGCVFMPLIHTE